jgi:hypothetical protein
LLDTLQPWRDSYLRTDGLCVGNHRSLADLGYSTSPLTVSTPEQLTALAHVDGLFNEQGITQLRRACYQLEAGSSTSAWIISNRTRAATESSTLIREMMNSRAFLLAVSRIAGSVGAPSIRARPFSSQLLLSPESQDDRAQIGMWHTDGTSFVLNIVLSDPSEYDGGAFVHFRGRLNASM